MSSEREIHFHRERHYGSVYYWPITAKRVAITLGTLMGGMGAAWVVGTIGSWLRAPSGLVLVLALAAGFGGLAAWLLFAHRYSED